MQQNPGFFQKLSQGLKKSKERFIGSIQESLVGERELDEDLFDEIEAKLISSDFGVKTARMIIEEITKQYQARTITKEKEVWQSIQKIIGDILHQAEQAIALKENEPTVLMFIGVNGVGKTTSIGKIAYQFQKNQKKVLLAAGDTFRAAAIEQLKEWKERTNTEIIANTSGSDPSATLFQASKKAKEEQFDVLLCDTSGRLHTQIGLMDELAKMKRVIQKNILDAPHYTILVIDAATGQNAFQQTKQFASQIGVDGLVVTKLDGTAKAGMLIGIVNEFSLPVYYIGIGEAVDDLQPFHADEFIKSLFA